MYNALTVERLMREQRKNGSDMAEYIFGDRRHTVRHLVKEGANPTAELVEKVADFLGVSIDVVYGRNDRTPESERNVELMEKLIRSQEIRLNEQKEKEGLLEDKIRLLQYELDLARAELKKFGK